MITWLDSVRGLEVAASQACVPAFQFHSSGSLLLLIEIQICALN